MTKNRKELLVFSTSIARTQELTRSAYDGNDRFSIALAAGKRTLLLKIAQRSGDWACVVDAADSEGWPIAIFGNQPEQEKN